jgi:hypothetical protein
MSHPWAYRESIRGRTDRIDLYREQGPGVRALRVETVARRNRLRRVPRAGFAVRLLSFLPAEFWLFVGIACYFGYWWLVIWLGDAIQAASHAAR